MRTFILAHPEARRRAHAAIDEAPDGYTVKISEPKRSSDANAKFHAMLQDLSDQWTLHGRKWDLESMKRLCIDQFKRDTTGDPEFAAAWRELGAIEIAPSIDGTGVVALGTQSRRFPKKLASGFIQWLDALGAEVGVTWSDERTAA